MAYLSTDKAFWSYDQAVERNYIDFWEMMQRWYITPEGEVIGITYQYVEKATLENHRLVEIDKATAQIAVASPGVVAELIYNVCSMRKNF